MTITLQGVMEFHHDETMKMRIWQKAKPCKRDEGGFRVDDYGAVMQWSAYGDTDHKYGWQVDHICPKSHGGQDTLNNLRPLYWENNQARNQKPPQTFLTFNPETQKNDMPVSN